MASSDEIEEELASIEAILIEGLQIERRPEDGRPKSVTYQCSPLVASEEDRSYVGLTLIVHITENYPNEVPKVEIRNPRGLDENDVNDLVQNLVEKCEQFVGGPVVFALIDFCQEFLTERNVPACPCAICLRHIVGDDDFVKTSCFHYFHSICFGRYVKNVYDTPADDESKIKNGDVLSCPVCRGELPDVERAELNRLLSSRSPVLEAEEKEFCLTRELKELQGKMQKLFIKQKEAGGIIDIEAEAKKFLIVTSQAGGSEEGHSGQQQAAFSEPDSGTHQRPVVAQAAAEQSKKHKGGSGMGKRRDFGDRKRNTRRRN